MNIVLEIARLIIDFVQVLVWPGTVLIICLIFKGEVVAVLNRIRHAELPGGLALDLEQDIKEAKVLSAKVQKQPSPTEMKPDQPMIQLTEANARMIQLGLRPSPSGLDMRYYKNLAEIDPNVALAGLRIEIDVLAHNLATGFKVSIESHEFGSRLLRKLYDAGSITSEQMQLSMKILSVCNAAVHGSSVTREEANDVIHSAEVLAEQFLAWLSWGFEDGWMPTKETGSD